MRSSSTVPHITALLRTRRASLRSSYLVLVTPFNSHDVIQTPASFDDENASAKLSDYSGRTGLLLVSGVCGY
jgi:hypothetical protein